LYSIITALRYQLNLSIDLNSLKSSLFIEITSHPDRYSPFLPDEEDNLLTSLNKYIRLKHYNSGLGDILPLVLSNIYLVNIRILDQQRHSLQILDISPSFTTSLDSITIHRSGDHYNGIGFASEDPAGIVSGPGGSHGSSGVCGEILRHQKRLGVLSSDIGDTACGGIPSQQERTGVTSTNTSDPPGRNIIKIT
jgi:hypothetical protein